MPLKVHLLSGTNQSRPVSVEETVCEFSQQPAVLLTDGNNENEDEESDKQIVHSSRNEVGKAINFDQIKSVYREFRL